MVRLQEYLDTAGRNRYREWFNALEVAAATKVTVALERLAQGNKSSVKPLVEGVSEYRIDWGPGYRIYLGQDGERLVVLHGGGSKKRQNRDIEEAKAAWREYKQRKRATRKDFAVKTISKPKREN